jgi:serine/threonine-protein kinase SRPK3
LTADSSKDSAELRHLQSLADYSHGNLGSKYIVQLHDNFLHQGPNGRHQCLVFELLGPSVDAVLREYCREKEPVEPETVLKMSKQLLQAVSFIHEAGYAHGGMMSYSHFTIYLSLVVPSFVFMSVTDLIADLSGGNVSFTSKRLSKSAEKDLFEVIGVPQTEPLARQDGKPLAKGLPNQLVQAASWLNWDDEDDEDLRIIDLGEAFRKGAEPRELAQPGSLRAPETIFTNRFDYRVDLWRAGIMVVPLELSKEKH